MATTINTFGGLQEENEFKSDLRTISVSDKVLNVNMNQFTYSENVPIYSGGYATCIGILVATEGKGCLAHVDMNVPSASGYNQTDWPAQNVRLYERTISKMLEVVGAPSDLVLFASGYSRSGQDKSLDLLADLITWALNEHDEGRLTGVYDFRTHPDRKMTDKFGTVTYKYSLEHFGTALYFPSSDRIHLFQGDGRDTGKHTWAAINKKRNKAIDSKLCTALQANTSLDFAKNRTNFRAMKVKKSSTSAAMISAET